MTGVGRGGPSKGSDSDSDMDTTFEAQPRRRKPAFVTYDNEASLCEARRAAAVGGGPPAGGCVGALKVVKGRGGAGRQQGRGRAGAGAGDAGAAGPPHRIVVPRISNE